MKAIGRSVALVIAGAASPLGDREATSRPSAEKQATPTMKVTAAAGTVRGIRSIP